MSTSIKRRGVYYNDFCSNKELRFVEETIQTISITNEKILIDVLIDNEELSITINMPDDNLKQTLIPIKIKNFSNLPTFTIYMQTFETEIYLMLPQHTIVIKRDKKNNASFSVYNACL